MSPSGKNKSKNGGNNGNNGNQNPPGAGGGSEGDISNVTNDIQFSGGIGSGQQSTPSHSKTKSAAEKKAEAESRVLRPETEFEVNRIDPLQGDEEEEVTLIHSGLCEAANIAVAMDKRSIAKKKQLTAIVNKINAGLQKIRARQAREPDEEMNTTAQAVELSNLVQGCIIENTDKHFEAMKRDMMTQLRLEMAVTGQGAGQQSVILAQNTKLQQENRALAGKLIAMEAQLKQMNADSAALKAKLDQVLKHQSERSRSSQRAPGASTSQAHANPPGVQQQSARQTNSKGPPATIQQRPQPQQRPVQQRFMSPQARGNQNGRQQMAQPSYAEIMSKVPYRARNSAPQTRDDVIRRVVMVVKDSQLEPRVDDLYEKEVPEIDIVSQPKVNRDKSISFSVRGESSVKAMDTAFESLKAKYTFTVTTERRPCLKIFGCFTKQQSNDQARIHSQRMLSSWKLLKEFAQRKGNAELDQYVRVLRRKNETNMILELDPQLYALATQGAAPNGYKRISFGWWNYGSLPDLSFSNCLGCGSPWHPKSKCSNPIANHETHYCCAYCAGEHSIGESCPKTPGSKKCKSCIFAKRAKVNHTAYDRRCPTIIAYLNQKSSSTNWGMF